MAVIVKEKVIPKSISSKTKVTNTDMPAILLTRCSRCNCATQSYRKGKKKYCDTCNCVKLK